MGCIYCGATDYNKHCLFLNTFFSYINIQTGDVKVQIYRGQEEAVVEQIKLCGNDRGDEELQKICIMLRIEVKTKSY